MAGSGAKVNRCKLLGERPREEIRGIASCTLPAQGFEGADVAVITWESGLSSARWWRP